MKFGGSNVYFCNSLGIFCGRNIEEYLFLQGGYFWVLGLPKPHHEIFVFVTQEEFFGEYSSLLRLENGRTNL